MNIEEENLGKIPYYATIYNPPENELVNQLLGKHTRRIFEVPIEEYNEYEKQKLIDFYEYCKKQNYKIPPKTKGGKYLYPNIFRQLQGSDFNIEKGFGEIVKEINFKNEKLPIEICDDFFKILNSGFIYVHGRDKYYRPLIFVNPAIFNSIDCPVETWNKFGIFVMELFVNKLLLPSKIENWNIIVDFGGLNLGNIPWKLKEVFTSFKGIYRCRLFKAYLLNMNILLNMAWGVVKMIMGPTLEAKACNVSNNNGKYDNLFNLINREQVEKKYGGMAEDLKPGEYFPPKFISDNYFCTEKEEKKQEGDTKIDSFYDSSSNTTFYEAMSD